MSEQPNTITTLKVYSSQKDDVNSIALRLGNDAGQKEVMEYLLTLDKMNQAKELGKEIPKLDDVRYHFSRIEGIFTEYVLSSRDKEAMDADTIMKLNETTAQQKIMLHDRIMEIEVLSEELKNITEKHETELLQQQGEIALIRENHQKEIESLKDLLTQTKEAKEQSDKLVKLTQEAAESANERLIHFTEKANEYDSLVNELKVVNEELFKMKTKFERVDVEKDKAVFEVERSYIEQISNLREELSVSRELIAELKITISKMTK